jgi:hypothetical protein
MKQVARWRHFLFPSVEILTIIDSISANHGASHVGHTGLSS